MRDSNSNRLTVLNVKRLGRPGRYADGGGLYLQISRWRTKAWIFRFKRDGRERQMGLGPVHTVPLVDARERARQARRLLLDGTDPIIARSELNAQRRLEAARSKTFAQCAGSFITAQQAGWRNAKHAEQWRATLATYADPIFGELPVAAIDTAVVLKALEPIWTAKTETAGRVRGRIERVLDWAKVRGYRDGENPARWKGHLDKLLPARAKVRPVKHHPALPYDELPAFMAELRDRDGIGARALEFTILTAARTGEVIGAQRAEIDLVEKTWTVPASRMKAGKEHRVPLSARAIEIVKSLPRADGGSYLFGANAPPSNMMMLELMKGLRPGCVPHGFRSTFRDWAAEQTNYATHVVEKALAHVVADKVEAAYRRGDLFDKRRRLMADWARYCAQAPAATARTGSNVTPLRKHAS
jgi:integrase